MEIPPAHIPLFKSLFRGREDVFAVRWEKDKKSGYMPAYYYDPYRLRAHKMAGGTFQNFAEKEYLKLSDTQIEKHLRGEQQIGLYPLLTDNTSWFLVADFDKSNWAEEAKQFVNACRDKRIFAYLERSRSGNGGHVWIFFEKPYPAVKSRKIFISILEESGVFLIFDKSSSFDRLFPNQDFLSGKGFGNLIALPLNGKTFELGNSCFIDTKTLIPFPNQWKFLSQIQRISITDLDSLHNEISSTIIEEKQSDFKCLTIKLDNSISLNRSHLTLPLINFLKSELNFSNSEFFVKSKAGRNIFNTKRYFNLVEESNNEVKIPRGFTGKLIRFCRENNIEFDFQDNRAKFIPITFPFKAQLREYQQRAVEATRQKDFGVIVLPPGSGKTLIGLKIIEEKQQSALIVVHRKQLLEQWVERIEAFLGIPKREIGIISSGKRSIGEKVTIATIQSLSNTSLNSDLSPFRTIIIDECHHIPAETYSNTINRLKTYYLYGLTATPFRKYNDGKLIFAFIGDIISEITHEQISPNKQANIIVRNTDLNVPFNSKTDQFEVLSQILIHDSNRNKLILSDIVNELKKNRKAVVITERKEHIESLYQYLKQSFEVVALSGDDNEKQRSAKWATLKSGNFQVLITTGQFFGEGSDLQNINCLFLVYPFAFKGKLIQYIGRVQRSEITPIIYDYRDIQIDYLNKLFLKRNVYYRKIDRQATLFDDPAEDNLPTKNTEIDERKIKIPIEELDFRYGGIAFNYQINNTNFEFEIENLEIRPEFEVLKPYFSKYFQSKHINADIYVEFENGKIVSQNAISTDIDKINREIIESVRFRFVQKNIIGQKQPFQKKNILTAEELQNGNPLYANGEELLNEILENDKYKHSLQLKYLSTLHEGSVMKIRFVLSPFSFIFLLPGKQNYHIVLETLDTEEATYLWHIDKSKSTLIQAVNEIDIQLNIIRNQGRQAFLDTNPADFSKILHDYSDRKKGFIVWKGMLEEHLI